jgi:hypothetical protein
MTKTVQINRNDLAQSRIVESGDVPLPEGAVRLRIESFSVTANNVTYAVAGDSFGYWNFFPGDEGWGVVPMWGHAVVEVSNHPEIAVGERLHGYLPMASHLDVLPVKVSAASFTDSAAHRQPMSPFYNQYNRLAADPEHDPLREGERMIFGGLFKTGFLIEGFMRRESWFGAEALICTSASSKAAMGLASVARDRSPSIRRIGLTSPGNVDFVRATGLYDEVVAYGDVASLPQRAAVSVDFAGNANVLRAIHECLDGMLKYSCLVGFTHVGERSSDDSPYPGPVPTLFFAPDHALAAIQELGPKGFGEAVAKSWATFLGDVDGALRIERRKGLEAARDAFAATLAGKADPAVGIVIEP